MAVITKIGVGSSAHFSTILGAIIGLLSGLFVTTTALIGTGSLTDKLSIIIFPIIFGISGLILGVILALLINFTLKIMNGLVVNLLGED